MSLKKSEMFKIRKNFYVYELGMTFRVSGLSSCHVKVQIFYYLIKFKPNINNNSVKNINPNII